MQVAVLATGGKDSTLALHRVLNRGYEITCLVSMIPLRKDSWMFHYPNIHLVDLLAEAVDIPLVKAKTLGVKESEVEDLERLIEQLDVDAIVSGTIASTYQKSRIEKICDKLSLKCIMPLWHNEPLNILRDIIDLKFNVIITGVYAYGFNREWIGKEINEVTLKALLVLNRKYGVSLVGEGGEYETLVLDAPFYKKRLEIQESRNLWEKQSGYLLVTRATLIPK